MVDHKRWQYKRVVCALKYAETHFDNAGSEGWELVSVIHEELSDEQKTGRSTDQKAIGYFKREWDLYFRAERDL